MMFVEEFDRTINYRMIVYQLLQDARDEVSNCLHRLLSVVAIYAYCRDVIAPIECFEMVYDDRSNTDL